MDDTLNTSFGLEDQRKGTKTIYEERINADDIGIDARSHQEEREIQSSSHTNITPAGIKREAEEYLQSRNTSVADLILQKYAHLQITDATNIPPPVSVIKIGGESIATKGNVLTISGAPKAAKSALGSVIIAGSLAVGAYDGFEGLEILNCAGKAILHFDTEQSRHQHQTNLKSTLKRVSLATCPPNLSSYNIRGEDMSSYKLMTEQIFAAANEKFGGVHLAVIDGGADYISDVNEPNKSNILVKFFGDLALKYDTVIVVIVHVNPNTEKERGHFGSELQRKSESVLIVKKQAEISCVEPKFMRRAGDIPIIQFMYDKQKGYHVYCGFHQPEDENTKNLRRVEELRHIAASVFPPPNSFTYSEAIDSIMRHTCKGETVAKNRFKEMRAHEMIVKGADKNWRLNMV